MKIVRLILSLFTLLLLVGCTGGDSVITNDEIDTNLFDVYQSDGFSIGYPKGWKVRDDFTSDLTKATSVAFISHVKEFFFTPTVTVSFREVSNGVKVEDFIKATMDQNAKALLDFNLVEQENLVLPNAQPTKLNRFQGKLNAEDSLVEYFQTYVIFGSNAYIITGAHDPNGDPLLADSLVETLQNFRVR